MQQCCRWDYFLDWDYQKNYIPASTMKLTSVLVVLSLTLCCFSGVYSSDDGTEVDCSGYLQISRPDGTEIFACPKIFKQVCATDGITYTSECYICDQNLRQGTHVGKKHDGMCKQK